MGGAPSSLLLCIYCGSSITCSITVANLRTYGVPESTDRRLGVLPSSIPALSASATARRTPAAQPTSSARAAGLRCSGLAIGETVILLTLSPHPYLKHLLNVEGVAAE